MNDTEISPEKAAPPRPDYTRNQDFIIRAVMPGHPATSITLKSWWVAAERDDGSGDWVTWEAYRSDGAQAGQLAYSGGHYETGPDAGVNRNRALADLAVRAGCMRGIARQIAGEVMSWTYAPAEDRRMARRLLKWTDR
jgi:hypothetical protein